MISARSNQNLIMKIFLCILTLFILIHPAAAQQVPSDTWMGIYLDKAKIGYAHFLIDKAEYQGKPGYRLDSLSVTRIPVLGVEVEQKIDTTTYLDDSFEPVYQEYKISSAGRTTTISAKFSPGEIKAEHESEGSKNTKTIPIPPGSKIAGDSTFLPPSLKLKIGDKLDYKWFNPFSLTLDDLQIEVIRIEPLTLGKGIYEAFVIKTTTSMGEVTCWQDEKGEVLKVAAIMGLTMIREPKIIAQSIGSGSGDYAPPNDLAVMTSAQTSTEIPKPREARYMKIRLSGLADKSLVIEDGRQKVISSGKKMITAEYEITASEFDRKKAAKLPIKNADMEKYLHDTLYIQPENSEIATTAKGIAGSEKNSYAIASRLRAWVNANIQSKANIGIVRSSVDVLRTKTGVCRDYAILYAALARAAGIPTKLVAGVVYWEGGFYYHAWAESYVGEWIPIDPTLSTDFVDATHIKLAEGEATAMFDMVKTMGNLKAEIIDYK